MASVRSTYIDQGGRDVEFAVLLGNISILTQKCVYFVYFVYFCRIIKEKNGTLT